MHFVRDYALAWFDQCCPENAKEMSRNNQKVLQSYVKEYLVKFLESWGGSRQDAMFDDKQY